MKIAFIGGGVMGDAILSAVLRKGLTSPQAIFVSDTNEVRHRYLEQEYGVAVMNNNRLAMSKGDIVVLAIKPQNLAEVMAELSGQFKPTQLVLSIVTAARISTICSGLSYSHVVRATPSKPAQIGEGMTVWMATAEVTEQQKGWADSILGAMGKQIYVDDERYIDMATAVSGSGPAYLALFMEALTDATVHIGMPRDMAEESVLQTILGSAHLMQRSGTPPSELRRVVTTPGGITAEALLQFEKGQFTELVKQAVMAAHKKAKELGVSTEMLATTYCPTVRVDSSTSEEH